MRALERTTRKPMGRSSRVRLPSPQGITRRTLCPMLDLIFIAGGIAFFVIAAAYAEGCDRL